MPRLNGKKCTAKRNDNGYDDDDSDGERMKNTKVKNKCALLVMAHFKFSKFTDDGKTGCRLYK